MGWISDYDRVMPGSSLEFICRACGKRSEHAGSACPSCGSTAIFRVQIRRKLITKRVWLWGLVVGFPIIVALISIPFVLLSYISLERAIGPLFICYLVYVIYAVPVIALFDWMGWPAILVSVSGGMIPAINGWWAVGMVALTYATVLIVIDLLVQGLHWLCKRRLRVVAGSRSSR